VALLEASGISVRFGGVRALEAVSMAVHRGEIVGLIGPNGAGKTTFFNCVSGLVAPNEGTVTFDGEDITPLPAHARAWLGIARTFQLVQTFLTMTVEDNLAVAAHTHTRSGLLADVFRLAGAAAADREALERARVVAGFIGIGPLLGARCADLPFGVQRQVELARALCLRPRLLLLDEAASGMDSTETAAFADVVRRARAAFGCAILWIEHDVPLISDVCDYVYVLDFGEPIAEGTPAEVVADPRVREAYTGSAGVEERPRGRPRRGRKKEAVS
jgi:branched-chain amino acid transport system ATP-binding protein